MTFHSPVLRAAAIAGGGLIAVGIAMWLAGAMLSGYTELVPIGIGTVIGAVFIFIMGMFLAAVEEALEKTRV